MQDLTGIILLWGIRVFLIILFTPLIILAAGHMAGVEKASLVRSVAISIFGLLLLVLLVLPVAANVARAVGIAPPISIPVLLDLPLAQLGVIYLVAWVILIKLGFESTFLDAFTVGVSSAVILLLLTAIILFLTSLPFIT